MSPIKRAASVSEISPCHSFLCKSFWCTYVHTGSRAGPVSGRSRFFATEISVTGMKIFPCEHSSPVTGTKHFRQNSFAFTRKRPKWYNFGLVCISTSRVCERALLLKLQVSPKFWQSRIVKVDVPPFWLCFLSHPGRPGWNFPYEHTTEFVPVTEPARLPGSYEEALNIEVCPERLRSMLEYWYIERGLLVFVLNGCSLALSESYI